MLNKTRTPNPNPEPQSLAPQVVVPLLLQKSPNLEAREERGCTAMLLAAAGHSFSTDIIAEGRAATVRRGVPHRASTVPVLQCCI